MPSEKNFDLQFIRLQLLDSAIVAISVCDDEETHALADKIGAIKLDKIVRQEQPSRRANSSNIALP
jgi:hypothetical protein